MIPGWKVKRELVRLGQQLRAIPEFFWEPFAIRAHNAAFEKGFPTFEGQVPELPKIAIVLCFQPKGLAKSFFITLAHLVINGYSPLVISNSKLSDQDKENLKPTTWRVVERPNFGYDFGGYRDGIFLLRKWNISPDRLVILNDSIWFPVWENDTTLQKAEESEFDVVGMVMREQDDFRFLESFFFSCKRGTIENEFFKNFWISIKLTSNKLKVVKRGERYFGKYMLLNGINFGPVFGQHDLKELIDDTSAEDLICAMDYFRKKSKMEQDFLKNIKFFSADKDLGGLRELFKFKIEKENFNENMQIIVAKKLGYPILKKGGASLAAWRSEWLRAIDEKFLPPPLPEIHKEVIDKCVSERSVKIDK